MVADDQDAYDAANDSKQKMVRKPIQIDAADVSFPNRKSFGSPGRFLNGSSQFCVEFIGQLTGRHPFVVVHDLFDIRSDFRMKDETHYFRRRSICWSSCSRDRPRAGSDSKSASRRKASAIPSSSSCSTAGSESSKWAARMARWPSDKSRASLSSSVTVGMS